jgi:hypothetical protein
VVQEATWPATGEVSPWFLRKQTDPVPPGSARSDADLRATRSRSSYVASITVSRISDEDVGFREVFILVDDRQVAILRFGDSFTCEVPAGPHRLRAHNTLFSKTHELVLQPGEHVRFVAVNRAGWGTFGLLLMLGVAPIYLRFERDTSWPEG